MRGDIGEMAMASPVGGMAPAVSCHWSDWRTSLRHWQARRHRPCYRQRKGARAMGESPVGLRIDIVSDAICPWCYIGKRQLERALTTLAQEGLRFSVHWNPFQLNPDMPKEGRDRSAYRAMKFGSAERARELDERVGSAAAAVGLNFRQDLMLRTPNTIDAHRLIWLAGRQDVQDAVMEAVFRAYFMQGRDIGDTDVLADCAAAAGMDRASVVDFLAGEVAAQEMRAADQAAREAGA